MCIFKNIPQEMKDTDSWLVWYKSSYEGRVKKNPVGVPVNEFKADMSTYPLLPYDKATGVLEYLRRKDAKTYYGLGFGFTMEHRIAGIDLDDVFSVNGDINEDSFTLVRPILEQAHRDGLYVERSLSDRGLHIYGYCDMKDGLVKEEARGQIILPFIEIYYATSHFVVTGDVVEKGFGRIDDTVRVALEQQEKLKKEFFG